MDCESVGSSMMGLLDGELDEVTTAALKRHIAGCSECAALFSRLSATRRLTALPVLEPPADLERRILQAAGNHPAMVIEPHFIRVVSAAGSWAMRPQTAMAAVFLVMLGASVLLLRGRSSRAPASAEMIVTEQGTPAPASSFLSVPPQPQAIEPLANESHASPKKSQVPNAAATSSDSISGTARRDRELKISTPSSNSSAGLTAARAVRDSQGCRAAVYRFDEVAQHGSGSSAGWEALLESARCYRAIGDAANARARLMTLLGVAPFRDRARAELDQIDRPAAASSPQ